MRLVLTDGSHGAARLAWAGCGTFLQLLIVATEAIRSNWIVAIRSAMLAAQASSKGAASPIEIDEPITATIRSRLHGPASDGTDLTTQRAARRGARF